MQLLVIAALLFAAVSVLFAVQNNVPVTVTFLLWRFDGSLALVLLIAMALGGLIVALASTPSTLRGQWERKRQRKRIAELEQSCSAQEARLAQLQRAAPEAEPAPQEPSYVGLKQLVVGASGGAKPGSGGSN